MDINFDASKPIYEQIIDEIKKMVVRGELKPGDKLPSQRDMAKRIEVNPNTIQRAYREMEVRNLVETKRGMGTFIIEGEDTIKNIRDEMAKAAAVKFLDEMVGLGFSRAEIRAWIKEELEKVESEV